MMALLRTVATIGALLLLEGYCGCLGLLGPVNERLDLASSPAAVRVRACSMLTVCKIV